MDHGDTATDGQVELGGGVYGPTAASSISSIWMRTSALGVRHASGLLSIGAPPAQGRSSALGSVAVPFSQRCRSLGRGGAAFCRRTDQRWVASHPPVAAAEQGVPFLSR
jgi:hypothetical protein